MLICLVIALVALEGFLPRVDHFVRTKLKWSEATLSTILTFMVRTSMNKIKFFQIPMLSELFITFVALEGFLPEVGLEMSSRYNRYVK